MSLPIESILEPGDELPANVDPIVTALLNQREEAKQLVSTICNAVERLNTLKAETCKIRGHTFNKLAYQLRDHLCLVSDNQEATLRHGMHDIDKIFWNSLFNETGLSQLVNTETKEELRKLKIEDQPAFEADAVYSTLKQHYDNRLHTFVEGAIKIFEELDANFKSNDGICLRQKIIFSKCLYTSGWCSYSSAKNKVIDLERVFAILDKRDPATLQASHDLAKRLAKAKHEELDSYEDDLFSARLFQNGNIHLTIKRQDLIDEFNQLLSRYYGEHLGKRTAAR